MRDRYGPLVTGVSSKFITRVGKYVAQPGLAAILSHRVSASAACQRVAAGLATGEFAVVFVDRWRVPALIPVQVWLRVSTAECEKGSVPDHASAPSQACWPVVRRSAGRPSNRERTFAPSLSAALSSPNRSQGPRESGRR